MNWTITSQIENAKRATPKNFISKLKEKLPEIYVIQTKNDYSITGIKDCLEFIDTVKTMSKKEPTIARKIHSKLRINKEGKVIENIAYNDIIVTFS